MSRFNTPLLGLTAALALFGGGQASASSLQVWNGTAWTGNGTTHLIGPISITSVGTLPCNADLTMTIVNGSAAITNVALSGSAHCAAVTTYYLPWPAVPSAIPYSGANPPFTGAPVLTPTLWTLTISGVRLSVPPPFSIVCPTAAPPATGSIIGVLDLASGSPTTPNRLVFKQNLGTCVVQTRTNTPPNSLTANPSIRVVP